MLEASNDCGNRQLSTMMDVATGSLGPAPQFRWREGHRFVGFIDVEIGVLGAAINRHLHDDAGAFFCAECAINGVALHQSPLAARSPVAIEIVVGILRVLAGMLFPVWILHPHTVSGFVVLLLQRCKKLVYDVLFRPVTKAPHQDSYQQYGNDDGGDDLFAAALTGKVWLWSIEQRHNHLSITETVVWSKVPEELHPGVRKERRVEDPLLSALFAGPYTRKATR